MSEPSDSASRSQDPSPRASQWVIPEYMYEIMEEDPEIAGEILYLFFDTAAETMEKLTVSIWQHDAESVYRLAHTLTGSTRQLGANDMACFAEAMETSARQGDLTGMSESIVYMKSMLESLYTEVQNRVGIKPGHDGLGGFTSRIRRCE